jgi:hypothetical protein
MTLTLSRRSCRRKERKEERKKGRKKGRKKERKKIRDRHCPNTSTSTDVQDSLTEGQ